VGELLQLGELLFDHRRDDLSGLLLELDVDHDFSLRL
jgi:hypothetical protein